jgi:hypothetical protein
VEWRATGAGAGASNSCSAVGRRAQCLPARAAAPVDPSDYAFIALDTSTPYVLDFAGADAGKTAHYILRWVSTRGQKGPWSETVSATIGG